MDAAVKKALQCACPFRYLRLPRRYEPAGRCEQTQLILWPLHSYPSEIESRVVPGTESTTARSRPSSRFKSELLPTFGRPMSATLPTEPSPDHPA
eukprot:scaffold14486_cov67-Isochrysis_galbana.AAC.1